MVDPYTRGVPEPGRPGSTHVEDTDSHTGPVSSVSLTFYLLIVFLLAYLTYFRLSYPSLTYFFFYLLSYFVLTLSVLPDFPVEKVTDGLCPSFQVVVTVTECRLRCHR